MDSNPLDEIRRLALLGELAQSVCEIACSALDAIGGGAQRLDLFR